MAQGSTAPEGIRLLREFLDKRGSNPTAFAREHGLNDNYLQRILRGERWRLNADLILAIDEATGGEVPVSAWKLGAAGRPTAKRTTRPLRGAAKPRAGKRAAKRGGRGSR